MTLLALFFFLGVAYPNVPASAQYVSSPPPEESECPVDWVKVDDACLRAELAQTGEGRGAPVTWSQARVLCQALYLATDLAIISDSEQLEAFYDYVAATFPDETSMGWVYWVGGYKVDGHRWRWINEDEINLRSHIWLPSAPTVDNTTANTLLVPANQEHRRFYLSQQLEGRTAPAYVCQIATGLRPFQVSSKIHSVSHEVPQDQTPPKT